MGKIVSHPLTVAVLSTIILKSCELIWKAVGGPNPLETFWQNFVVGLWPIWLGATVGGLYWLFRFLKDIHEDIPVLITDINLLKLKEGRARTALNDNLSGRINSLDQRLLAIENIVPRSLDTSKESK